MPVTYRNIARVVRPHGSKGEVLVAPLRGLPLLVHEGMRVALTPPALKRERFSVVERVRGISDEGAIVQFSCSQSLSEAEPLSGCYLLADAAGLDIGPLTAAVDELIGRAVIDDRHGELGTIREVLETPANDVWTVDGTPRGEILIPVISDVIDAIPLHGPIPVHIMDGLLDL